MAKPRVVIRWKTKYKPAPPSPLPDQAAAIAKGIIDPQVAEINRGIAAKQLAAEKAHTAAMGTAQALAAMQAGVPQTVKDAYLQAAQQTSGFAQGLTGAVGEQAQSAAATAAEKIASMGGVGTITSQAPAAMNVERYAGGYLPASDLAATAAARMAEQSGYGAASQAALSQTDLQQMGASADEVNVLRAKGIDIANTRPAEVQKALITLREQQRADRELAMQQRASAAQIHQLNTAQARALESDAYNRSQLTGTLWTVKNGRLVNTGKTAAGSSAYQNVASQQQKQQEFRYQQQQDMISNAFKQAGLQIDAKRAKAYAASQSRMHRTAAKGGFTALQKQKMAVTAFASAQQAYEGVPATDKSAGVPQQPARKVLRDLMGNGIPYEIAYNAVRRFAKMEGSHWAEAMNWQKVWPPRPGGSKKKKK